MSDEVKVLDMTHADEATHTIDRASGQAVAIGLDRRNQAGADEVQPALQSSVSDGGSTVCVGFKAGQSANGGLGEEVEVSPTMSHQPSALEPTVATMLKVRCGADTYTKPDGSTGTAGKGPLASEESAFTLAATQDQHLVLRHIVRRLSPTECSRLQGFPDQWCRIPMGKWRKIDEAEADYLRSQGAWVGPHIRPRKDGGIETDLAPDSPMYRCLGNSWATNCAEWILRRVVAAIRLGLIQ